MSSFNFDSIKEQLESIEENTLYYKNIIRKEESFLNICKLSKKHLSSNMYSCLIENIIKKRFKIEKCKDNTSGDGISINNKNIEIKISLGDSTGKMNFVQLRPDHKIDFYLMLTYNKKEDKIFWFLCDPIILYNLLPEYGGYSHGTIKKLGKINLNNIYGRNLEYSLRPNPDKTGKSKKIMGFFYR